MFVHCLVGSSSEVWRGNALRREEREIKLKTLSAKQIISLYSLGYDPILTSQMYVTGDVLVAITCYNISNSYYS